MKWQQFNAAHPGWGVLAALYAAALLVILCLAYTGNVPSQLSQIPFYDKIGHVVLYGIAAYLGHRVFGYRQMTLLTIVVPLFPLLFGLGTVIEELLQSLSPNRTLDVIDLVASFSGIAIGYGLAEKGR